MKVLIFLILVSVSICYLLSQTEGGSGIFSSKYLEGYLPRHQIAQASDDLLKHVDKRLQQVATKLALEQQQGLAQLEQRISALSVHLTQAPDLPLSDREQQQGSLPQHTPNKDPKENINLSPQPETRQYDENDHQTLAQNISPEKAADQKALQRQKQASLQFITSRMEQLAVEVSSAY